MDTVQLVRSLLKPAPLAWLSFLLCFSRDGSFDRAVETCCSFHSWLDTVPANLIPAEPKRKAKQMVLGSIFQLLLTPAAVIFHYNLGLKEASWHRHPGSQMA